MLKYFYAWAVMHQFILRIFRNRFPDSLLHRSRTSNSQHPHTAFCGIQCITNLSGR
jgi:hypothetical protein